MQIAWRGECDAGQEVEGDVGVLKEVCAEEVGVDLVEMGVLGA